MATPDDFTIVIDVKGTKPMPTIRAYTNEGYTDILPDQRITWDRLHEIIEAIGYPLLLNEAEAVRKRAVAHIRNQIKSIEERAATLDSLRADLAALEP